MFLMLNANLDRLLISYNTFSMISTDGEFGCDETINAIKTNN